MEQPPIKAPRRCSDCRLSEPEVAFYANSKNAKCRECQKARSRRYRRERAKKVALADQFAAFMASYQDQPSAVIVPVDEKAS